MIKGWIMPDFIRDKEDFELEELPIHVHQTSPDAIEFEETVIGDVELYGYGFLRNCAVPAHLIGKKVRVIVSPID